MNSTKDAQMIEPDASIEREGLLETLGLSEYQSKLFRGFPVSLLRQFVAAGLSAKELYTVVQDHCDRHYMEAYVQLRQRGLTEEELRPIQRPDYFLLGLDAKLPRSVLKRADKEGVAVQTLIDGRRAKVSIEHMFKINSMRNQSDLLPYIQCRQEGYSHKQLLDVLELADPNAWDFDCVAYFKVRQADVTHAQVMNMLEKLFGKTQQRAYYVEHVTAELTLGHNVALDLAVRGISLKRYIEVSEDLTYQQIADGLDRGVSLDSLLECVYFQQANGHIQLDEVIQYYMLTKHFVGIDVYLVLLGARIKHTEIEDALEHELSMNVYGRLRLHPMKLSHDDAISVVNHDIDPEYYMKLRREGMAHATILLEVE